MRIKDKTDKWLMAYVKALRDDGWTDHEINTIGTNWYDVRIPPWENMSVDDAVKLAKKAKVLFK